jgi:hypothetical protein
VAVGTAKSRVSRARAELGRILAAEDARDPAGDGPHAVPTGPDVTAPRPDATGRPDVRGPPPP